MTSSADLTAGIHLPQAGPAASGEALTKTAVLAEELGWADVWVSDHLVVPTDASYPPSAYIYEPMVALTWAAAVTQRVRLGTTVLVLPMRNPIAVAKMVASLDQLSGGRFILGTAAGWLKEEFDALAVPYAERGPRTDEAIAMLRRMWTDDHITESFPVHGAEFVSMRAKPQPAGHVPIWIGGHAEVALRRAVTVGDGWHGGFLPPDETAVAVKRLRRDRPESDFVVSMRTRWDGLEDSHDEILSELEAYVAAGVNHVVPEPRQRTLTGYLKSIEQLTEVFQRFGVPMAT